MKAQAIKYLNELITEETTKKEIDLIEFIKKCVRDTKETTREPPVDWQKYFETLWKMYPRKVNKELAKRTFEHKIRGLNEEECKDKCNKIYKAQMIYQNDIKERNVDKFYVLHYSSFLNANIPNSPHYKGR